MIIGVVMIIISIVGYINLSSPSSVDVDCLIDAVEEANITEISQTYGHGIVDSTWTLNQVENFYWFKHPKTRWAAKVALNYYLKQCEN